MAGSRRDAGAGALAAPSFRSRTLHEDFPPVAVPVSDVLEEPVHVAPAVPSPAASPTPQPAPTATSLSAGRIGGLAGHQASGRVALYRLGGGTVLRFEDVDISGGAKPSVHLVPPGQHRPEGGVALGPLKAERGTFSYPVPGAAKADATWTVLVWCEPYDVPIGAADLH